MEEMMHQSGFAHILRPGIERSDAAGHTRSRHSHAPMVSQMIAKAKTWSMHDQGRSDPSARCRRVFPRERQKRVSLDPIATKLPTCCVVGQHLSSVAQAYPQMQRFLAEGSD